MAATGLAFDYFGNTETVAAFLEDMQFGGDIGVSQRTEQCDAVGQRWHGPVVFAARQMKLGAASGPTVFSQE